MISRTDPSATVASKSRNRHDPSRPSSTSRAARLALAGPLADGPNSTSAANSSFWLLSTVPYHRSPTDRAVILAEELRACIRNRTSSDDQEIAVDGQLTRLHKGAHVPIEGCFDIHPDPPPSEQSSKGDT